MKERAKTFASELVQRLNLGTRWNQNIACILILNYAPPSCLTYQDKDNNLQANKIDPLQPLYSITDEDSSPFNLT
jgi:hypothetical protein